jgi:hypothetical protein
MIIEGNTMVRHLVEASIPQGSPASQILFAICTSARINRVVERVSGVAGLSFIDEVGWVATGNDINLVGRKPEG